MTGFAGARRLGSTGLLYMRRRAYDPTLGRFLSRDPSRFHRGRNLYAFAGLRPSAARDPSGLVLEIIGDDGQRQLFKSILQTLTGVQLTGGQKSERTDTYPGDKKPRLSYTSETFSSVDSCQAPDPLAGSFLLRSNLISIVNSTEKFRLMFALTDHLKEMALSGGGGFFNRTFRTAVVYPNLSEVPNQRGLGPSAVYHVDFANTVAHELLGHGAFLLNGPSGSSEQDSQRYAIEMENLANVVTGHNLRRTDDINLLDDVAETDASAVIDMMKAGFPNFNWDDWWWFK